MPAVANPAQIRVILQQTLGQLGPQILPDGQVDDDGDAMPTLVDKLNKPDVPKPPGPSIFGGTQQENPVEWHDWITDHIEHAGYRNDAEKLRVVRMYLKGRAAIWYKHLGDAQKEDFDAFLVAFNAKFLEGESILCPTSLVC